MFIQNVKADCLTYTPSYATYLAEYMQDLPALKRDVEEQLREKLIFTADVDLLPPGTLPRFEMKAQLIKRV